MKFDWRTEIPQWLMLAAMFVAAAVLWPSSPERLPIHWDTHGRVNGWGNRFEGLLFVPVTALATYLLLLLLPRIDPGRANYASFSRTYTTLRVAMLTFLAAVYGLMVVAGRGRRVSMETWVPLLVGAVFVLTGNAMGKFRPTWFVGIRTPWTLSSAYSWNRTHRVGGWAFIGLGVALMVMPPVAHWIGPVIVGLVVGLVAYSYLMWKRDPDKQPPAGRLPA